MSVQSITSRSSQVAGAYANPFLINNPSTATVYLGPDSSIAIGNQSVSLTPGASCQWSGECWAVTAAGATANIEVAPNSGGLTAPGPTSVTLGGPVAIDPNGNAVSVPGTVNTQVGTVSTTLSQRLTNFNVGTVTTQTLYDSNGTSLTPYQALVMQFGGNAMSGVNTAMSLRITITQFDAAGNVLLVETPGYYGTGMLRYTTPIVGARVVVQALNFGSGIAVITNWSIVGSASALKHSYYQFPGSSGTFFNCSDGGSLIQPTAKLSIVRPNVPASTSGTVFLETYGGRVFLQFQNSNAGSAAVSLTTNWGAGGTLLVAQPNPLTNVAASRYFLEQGFVLPELPITLQIDNGTTAQILTCGVLWE